MRLTKLISILSLTFTFSSLSLPLSAASIETAVFAGGCFWSMQHDFDKVPGVISTEVGYTGGKLANPTYEQVSTGTTGHYEAIKVTYNPDQISYNKLVEFYWHDIDPSDAAGQFCDHGNEYHSVIFYSDPAQHNVANASMNTLTQSGRFNRIATLIEPTKTFYPAEEYHQKYAEKNPVAYSAYRIGCGRDARSRLIWGSE